MNIIINAHQRPSCSCLEVLFTLEVEISIKIETPDVSPTDSFALAMHHVHTDTDNNEWENITDSCVKVRHHVDSV